MSSNSRTNWIPVIVLSLFVVAIITLVMLFPQLVSLVAVSSAPSDAQVGSADAQTASLALIRARAVLARVRDEIIPRDGQATNYGITFSDAGYQTLLQWNKDYQVEPRYADAFESLDMLLPCCEWRKPSRNEETNCACGHHQAMEGLAKKLLSEGRNSGAVQREVTLWARFFFPAEALGAEMERRALLDPEIKAALAELKARGEC